MYPLNTALKFIHVQKQFNSLNVLKMKKSARSGPTQRASDLITKRKTTLPVAGRRPWPLPHVVHFISHSVHRQNSAEIFGIQTSNTSAARNRLIRSEYQVARRGAGSSALQVSSFISPHPSLSHDKLLFVQYSRTNFSRCCLHACSLSHSILIAAPRIYTRLRKSARDRLIYGSVLRRLGWNWVPVAGHCVT